MLNILLRFKNMVCNFLLVKHFLSPLKAWFYWTMFVTELTSAVSRFINLGPLGGHWILPNSAVILSSAVSLGVYLALKASWKTLWDQAGSLYLSTGRMMFFFLAMIPGSKLFLYIFFLSWNAITLTVFPQLCFSCLEIDSTNYY